MQPIKITQWVVQRVLDSQFLCSYNGVYYWTTHKDGNIIGNITFYSTQEKALSACKDVLTDWAKPVKVIITLEIVEEQNEEDTDIV